MHARRAAAKRPKVLFRGEAYDAMVKPLGLDTLEAKAADLGVDVGNLSRIYRGQAVSAEFIARVKLRYPGVTYEHVFREELS